MQDVHLEGKYPTQLDDQKKISVLDIYDSRIFLKKNSKNFIHIAIK